MKASISFKKLTALLFSLCIFFSSCTGGRSNEPSTETDKAVQSTETITEAVTETEAVVETADPDEVKVALEEYNSYLTTHTNSLHKGFLTYNCLWFEKLGTLIEFGISSDKSYQYTFIDEFGFRVKASVTHVDVDDIDVYRTLISPYENGDSITEGRLNGENDMKKRKEYASKTVTLDDSHYTYNEAGDLIRVSTIYHGVLVEFTPADYSEKNVTFSNYKNRYGFLSNFISGWNAARVFTAGIYPQKSVYATSIDNFTAEADDNCYLFTDSVKVSDIIKNGSFIPNGYEVNSIDYYDLLDYQKYSQGEKNYNISLKGIEDDTKSISYSITYNKYGIDQDPFNNPTGEVIDESRGIICDSLNGSIRLKRIFAGSVSFFMLVDAESFTEDIKNTFTAFTDEVIMTVSADIQPDNKLPEKVTFASFFEIESFLTVIEKTPEKIEAYLERRGYAGRGFDTAEEASALADMLQSIPLLGADGGYNLSYFPDSGEFSVNYCIFSKNTSDEYKHIQFRYMSCDSAEINSLSKDATMPPLNLGSIVLDCCSYTDGVSCIAKWKDSQYGLIASETRYGNFDNENFFLSVYEIEI
ncbi:MAG: hypothetical protein E7672_09915 [Ruminococcaceae bacterium]|nr:hypothetical protein [Oscillospiraceae bacterium]